MAEINPLHTTGQSVRWPYFQRKTTNTTGHTAMIIPLIALIVVAAWVISRPIVRVLGV